MNAHDQQTTAASIFKSAGGEAGALFDTHNHGMADSAGTDKPGRGVFVRSAGDGDHLQHVGTGGAGGVNSVEEGATSCTDAGSTSEGGGSGESATNRAGELVLPPSIAFDDLPDELKNGAESSADDNEEPSKGRETGGTDGVSKAFKVDSRGVFYVGGDEDEPAWICSRLSVSALVRDGRSDNWGRLLEFFDADGKLHVWSLPMEMLKGDGADMRAELLRQGLKIAPGNKAKNRLSEYVMTCGPKARARCVSRTGWEGGAFVLPDQTIGQSGERVLFQAERMQREYAQAGSLENWQAQVAALCAGNSRLVVAVSAAFAAMLLAHAGMESGGLHFVGDSSTGKTTALRAAASVFGGQDYLHRWRATSNGLEGLAALHNDALLVLDELGQVDAREAGEIAYMLANGTGKARADRSGGVRNRQTWRLLFLSAGEIGLAQHMRDGGKKARAGQEVRLVEIPADAGRGFGMFEDLHGMDGGAVLSKAITDATQQQHGAAAVAFLNSFVNDLEDFPSWWKEQRATFLSDVLPESASGQAHRVAERFALIAAAGEYASANGVTNWALGEASKAAATCFAAWMEQRGGAGNQERVAIMAQVRAFFEAHGESRFTDLDVSDKKDTINRAGFRRKNGDGWEYLVLPEAFKRDICQGYDPKAVIKQLRESGWIVPDADGKAQKREPLPGMGRTRCYLFSTAMWES